MKHSGKTYYHNRPLPGYTLLADVFKTPWCVSITIKLHFDVVENTEVLADFVSDFLYLVKHSGYFDKYITDYSIPLTEKISSRTRQVGIDITGAITSRPKTFAEGKTEFVKFKDLSITWCQELCKKYGISLIHKIKNTPKQVVQYTLDGKLIKVWENASKAEFETGISSGNILTCARGKTSHAGGFKWKVLV